MGALLGFSMGYDSGIDSFMPIFVMVMIVVTFILTIGLIIYAVASRAYHWNKNNNSPRLTVGATVLSKRTEVSYYHHHNNVGNNIHRPSYTVHFVTFQVESGDRMELEMSGQDYGLLVEGDRGYLTFQGTRYLGFQRM